MGEYYKDSHMYDDIIHLPHHQSESRPHMSRQERAAQFAPFAALTGYEEAVEEAAKLAQMKAETMQRCVDLEDYNRL